MTHDELERAPVVVPESVVSEQGTPVEEPDASEEPERSPMIDPASPSGRLIGWITRAVRLARRLGRRLLGRLG